MVRTNICLAKASLKTRGRIVVLGDSHVGLFSGLPGFMPIHVGAVTMHRLGRPGELVNEVRGLRRPVLLLPGLRIGHRDAVLVSAGEIDVRCHVSEQVTVSDREEQEVIGDLVDRLVARLSELRARVGCRGGAVAVPPPVREIRVADGSPAIAYPIRGALADRVRWADILNERLGESLPKEGHVFLPMPGGLTNPDGSLRDDRSDGSVHLDPSLAGLVASGLPPDPSD